MIKLFANLAEPTDGDRESEDDLALRGAYDFDLEVLPCCGFPLRTLDGDETQLDLCAQCMPVVPTCEQQGCSVAATHEVTLGGRKMRLCRRHTDRTCADGTAVLNLGAAS